MIQIRFTTSGANSQLGGFAMGDTASVSEAFARHLVEEARVAKYVAAPVAAAGPAVDAETKPKTTRRKAAPKE